MASSGSERSLGEPKYTTPIPRRGLGYPTVSHPTDTPPLRIRRRSSAVLLFPCELAPSGQFHNGATIPLAVLSVPGHCQAWWPGPGTHRLYFPPAHPANSNCGIGSGCTRWLIESSVVGGFGFTRPPALIFLIVVIVVHNYCNLSNLRVAGFFLVSKFAGF
jgi:hypothetical protein